MSLQSREVSMKACMRCSNCRWLPSINQGSFAHICPSIRYGKFHSYSGGGKMITGYGLLHGAIDYDAKILDTIFSCSACGGCDVACASNLDDTVEPMEGIYALRQRVVEDGKLPPSLQVLLDNLKVHGSACGKAAGRGAWTGGGPQRSSRWGEVGPKLCRAKRDSKLGGRRQPLQGTVRRMSVEDTTR